MAMKFVYVLSVIASAIAVASADVEKPCKGGDVACIGKYLAKNSKCDPAKVVKDSDSFTVPFKRVYTPGFNVSEDRFDTKYTGISSGVVQDFFVNKETDKVVLTLKFPKLSYRSNSRAVNYYLPGKDAFVVKTKGYTTTLQGIIFTVIFESTKDLELSDADIYTHIPNLPTFKAEDDAIEKAAKKNPQVAAVQDRFDSFRGIPIMESQYIRAPEIITQFVNGKLCKYDTPADVPDRRCGGKKCGK